MKALRVTGIIAIIMAVFSATPMAFAAQPTVGLGTATPFAILAGTGITNVPNSVITGNVGVSPATGAAIVGLTCAEVTGTIYTVDAAGPICRVVNGPLLVTAKNDLTAAFIDAAGRTPVTATPTELGGTIKTTGVYDSNSTTFQITAGAGPLVLDGQGDPDAVFIFEMGANGTGLTVGPASTVSLINGASACNVFWRVDTASINTTATFKGTILALNSITVANGANIEGRLLARNGNVTLDSATVTVPAACSTTPGGGGTTGVTTPGFPNTGVVDVQKSNISLGLILSAGILVALSSLYIIRKKRAV